MEDGRLIFDSSREDIGCKENERRPEDNGPGRIFEAGLRSGPEPVTSLGAVIGVDGLGLLVPMSSLREAELAAALRVQRLTPSTAFNKLVDPRLKDRVMTSRVGANC